MVTLGRFAVNTVAGAGGALDPATEFSLPRENTDFGITLASWGVDEGPYLELPLFGPTDCARCGGDVGRYGFPTDNIRHGWHRGHNGDNDGFCVGDRSQ